LLRIFAVTGKRTLLGLVLLGLSFLGLWDILNGTDTIWSLWKIPPMDASFADLRNLTGAGESIALGHDPLYYNPRDPWNRPLNHPRLLQYLLTAFHLDLGDTQWLGILFGALFFIAPFIAFPKLDRPSAYLIGLLMFSPVAALGIERGNHDLFIFFLVAVALGLAGRMGISLLIFGIAAAIKLFPVFGIFYGCRYGPAKRAIGLFLLLFVVYLGLNRGDLAQIFNSTQKGYFLWGYGVRAFDETATASVYMPAGAMILATLLFYSNTVLVGGWSLKDSVYLDGFRVGAGIYLGTFLLGNCWAYRLIFLIFTVPQLVAWTKTDILRRRVAQVGLLSVVVSCCPTWISSGIIDEVFNWLLFSTLLYLWLSVLPEAWQRWILRLPSPAP
jgi:hypothetical protein